MPNAPTSERLLHAAPARMVWLRPAPDGGAPVVAKVFVQGSRSDAEREHAFADLCRGPGVVDSLGVGDDPATGRPCLLARHADGVDLAGRVANEGALPAATACALLAPVAATLARLHGMRDARAPHGISHGDVKPRNLLATAATTLLLDFEHAAPIGAAGGHAARGTLGFAAPEALAGAQPAAAADVFGLGATLQWLLAGGDGDVPQAPELAAFVRACTAADPQQRPTAAAAAEQLARFAARLPGEAAEATLTDWATGRFAAPPDAALATDPRAAAWTNRRRLLQRLPRLLDADLATPDQPAAIADALATVVAALQRFPRNGALLARRRALLDAVGRAIAGAGAAAASLRKRDEHAAADAWLGALERAARDAAATPMGLALPDDVDVPEAARRDPFGWLRLLREQAAADAADAADAIARVAACEAQLDVRAVEAAVAAIAAERGGASPLVAQLRDRLHRFGFYVERAARGGPSLARAASLRPAGAFDAPTAFVHAAAAGLGAARDDAAAALGLRSLLATLGSIAEEFPHAPTAASARDSLHAALAALTDDGWKLVGEARRLLQSVPVPVRPLQLTIGRLDTLRLLEALVDRPERSRSQLLDQIEGLRLQMDQARATRDRLAASAEHALARGHWTTGLFEMERAVARLDADDGGDKEAADKLQERLQTARRKKQDVEAAIKRNADLAARCASLQDDPGSASAARQQALAERRDCLLFLAMNVPEDRGALYRRDLREVDVQHALERASDAEAQLAGAADAEDRARRARAAVEELAEAIAALAADGEPPGRLLRALEHWRAVAAQCQRAIDDERARLVRKRRRRWLAAALVAVAAATAAGLTMWLRG
jgi:hypothetical protein